MKKFAVVICFFIMFVAVTQQVYATEYFKTSFESDREGAAPAGIGLTGTGGNISLTGNTRIFVTLNDENNVLKFNYNASKTLSSASTKTFALGSGKKIISFDMKNTLPNPQSSSGLLVYLKNTSLSKQTYLSNFQNNGANFIYGTTTQNVYVLNKWNHVDYILDIDTGNFSVYVNGSLKYTSILKYSVSDTNPAPAAYFQNVGLYFDIGILSSPTATDFLIDNIVVKDVEGGSLYNVKTRENEISFNSTMPLKASDLSNFKIKTNAEELAVGSIYDETPRGFKSGNYSYKINLTTPLPADDSSTLLVNAKNILDVNISPTAYNIELLDVASGKIGNIGAFNTEGPISKLTAGNVKFSGTIINNGDTTINPCMVVAVFDNKKMIDVKVKQIGEIGLDKSLEFNTDFVNAVSDSNEIKILLLDQINLLKPFDRYIIFDKIGFYNQKTSSTVLLDRIFSSNMVLQRNSEITLWGSAQPNTAVDVYVNNEKTTANASANGSWSANIGVLTEKEVYDITVVNEGKRQILKNILCGDVWLCSGQSNMARNMNEFNNSVADIPLSTLNNVRLWTKSGNNVAGQMIAWNEWRMCIPDNVKDFSATAYYFGKALSAQTDIPVGLIDAATGGARIQGFLTKPDLTALGYDPTLYAPSETLYNSDIKIWKSFPIAGVIWYQGESNSDVAAQNVVRTDLYEAMLKSFMARTRADFASPNLPFYIVQLPAFRSPSYFYPPVRQAQLNVSIDDERAYLVPIIELGDPIDNIHPEHKDEVGKRIANAVMTHYFNTPNTYSGPVYKSHTIEYDTETGKNVILVALDHAEGLRINDISGFEICGSDNVYVPAIAEVENGKIKIYGSIEEPVGARYGWSNTPDLSVANENGMPLVPFVTR